MKLKTLYARNKTGSVQQWTIEVKGNGFRTIVGQVDGKLVTSEWNHCEPKNVGKKNESSANEQAILEAEAKFKKKIKEGYFENVKDIDKVEFFQVTLAKKFNDYKKKIEWSKGVGVQIKYNGGRLVAVKEGLFSRTGERYMSVPHIEEFLEPVFQVHPKAILDGEAFNYQLREELNEIMKLLRKTVHITPEDFAASKEKIRFYIYDGFGIGNITQKHEYLARKQVIDLLFRKSYETNGIVQEVPTHIVYSEKELETLYQSFLADRQEGAILRILDASYENGRSKFLLKYKPVDDAEFKILDIQQGSGNWEGHAKVVTCQRIDGGQFSDGTDTFDATFKGTQEQAKKCLLEKANYIGKIATIYYNGLTGKGKPNYAQFDINNWDKGH